MDVGGVCCLCIEISWICFFVLKVNVVCCGCVVDKIFEWLDISMIVIIFKKISMCGLFGGSGGIFGVFLVILYEVFCVLAKGMVGRTCCALFDMVRDYLFFEFICTGGAVGVTEHIAWFFDFFFFGECGVKCHVFCAWNVVLMVCVLTFSVAVAGDLFVWFLIIRDVFFRKRL